MDVFIVDAFTNEIFGGNQAGVVLLSGDESFPTDWIMQRIAAELKHSETAFVRTETSGAYEIRYFTSEGEVPLCGHATVAAFAVLREEKRIGCGPYVAKTQAGELRAVVERDCIWLEMPRCEVVRRLSEKEANRVYEAYALTPADQPDSMIPSIAKAGLTDILLPVASRESLNRAVQNRGAAVALSKEYRVIGAHLFFRPPDGNPAAFCRNFAPLYGIDEEAATGTANASLTYYLYRLGLVSQEAVNTFVQGEAMGKPSVIRSKIDSEGTIHIGGNAVISLRGTIKI